MRMACSTDRPAAGAPAPAAGTCSTAASAALGGGGRGFHLSGAACPPSLSSSSSDDDHEFSGVTGGEPLLLVQPKLFAFLLPTLPPPYSPFLLAHCPLLLPPLRGAGGHPGLGNRWIRPRGGHGHALLMASVRIASVHRKEPKGMGKPTYRRGVGKHNQRSSRSVRMDLRWTARFALVATYS
jgi:hypothetical protein